MGRAVGASFGGRTACGYAFCRSQARIDADNEREDVERMDLLFGELNSNTYVESRSDQRPTPKRSGLLGWLFGR
ncbi:hypothetical protein ATY79_19155 [Rhizobium sp. R693]|nr:hypothetical protein ATY79_19155 [Rhizobium sp. R693]